MAAESVCRVSRAAHGVSLAALQYSSYRSLLGRQPLTVRLTSAVSAIKHSLTTRSEQQAGHYKAVQQQASSCIVGCAFISRLESSPQ